MLQAEASGAGAAVGERKFAVVDVSRGADRNVFVERRLLLIPSNTHTRALSEHEVLHVVFKIAPIVVRSRATGS